MMAQAASRAQLSAMKSAKPLLIGIAGGSGSGKSTVARNVVAALSADSVAFIDMDAYYHANAQLSMDARRRINFDHPDAIDWELLLSHLEALADSRPIEKPEYDFAKHTRQEKTTHVPAAEVVVVDGILVLADPRIRALFDMKIFVDTDADIRLIRRLQRDIVERGRPLGEILDQYQTTVQPMHLEFVEPSKRYADVIVPRGGDNTVAIEMIAAKIRHRATRSG
jgi:uridine kinase